MENPQRFRNYTKLFKVYLNKIRHEYFLINQRVKFNTVIQSALLATYTFLSSPNRVIVNPEIKGLVMTYIPWIGLFVTSIAICGVLIALYAQSLLRKRSDQVLDKWRMSEPDQSIVNLLPIHSHSGDRVTFIVGIVFGPWTFVLFGFFWGSILLTKA